MLKAFSQSSRLWLLKNKGGMPKGLSKPAFRSCFRRSRSSLCSQSSVDSSLLRISWLAMFCRRSAIDRLVAQGVRSHEFSDSMRKILFLRVDRGMPYSAAARRVPNLPLLMSLTAALRSSSVYERLLPNSFFLLKE